MQFFEYVDNFRIEKKNGTAEPTFLISPQYFYTPLIIQQAIEMAKADQQGLTDQKEGTRQFMQHMLGEWYWINSGRPYVKVFPKMTDVLSRIRLNVPWSMLKLPYPSFAIRFTQEQQQWFRETPETPPLQAIFVNMGMTVRDDTSRPLQFRYEHPKSGRKSEHDTFYKNVIVAPNTDILNIVLMMGNKVPPVDFFLYVNIHQNLSISDTLDGIEAAPTIDWNSLLKKEKPLGGYIPSPEFRRKAVSIVLASSLMINGENDNVLPDLPHKLIPRYEQSKKLQGAEREKINQELMEKARKANHLGVHIGSRYEVELPQPVYEKTESEGEGPTHELQYTHFRSAHPRLQPYGPRDNPEYKVIIVPMAQVRPDLPLNPNPKNYRITDRTSE